MGRDWYLLQAANSYVWDLPEWSRYSWHDVDFDLSAFGGPRPLTRRMRCSSSRMATLAIRCPGVGAGHSHKPKIQYFKKGIFRGFASKEELGLPDALAGKVAKLLFGDRQRPQRPLAGLPAAMSTFASYTRADGVDANKFRVAKLAAAAGWQARGRRLAQAIPEHRRGAYPRLRTNVRHL